MEKLKKYTFGLIAGIALMILGLDIIQGKIVLVSMLFDIQNINGFLVPIGEFCIRAMTVLSVFGSFITLYYAVRILLNLIMDKAK